MYLAVVGLQEEALVSLGAAVMICSGVCHLLPIFDLLTEAATSATF
jgi:hypothetical protein